MNDTVIHVEDLGKRYRIGAALKRPQSARQALWQVVQSPFRHLRRALTAAPEEEILWALKGVSFEVKRGEVVGIIGRNGAGKSTLLKILSRITEPTEGCAELRGRVGSLLEVGTGFNPELTGRENVYLNGAILGMKKAEVARKFDEIVAFSEVERFLDTPVKHYSSGMYVRLAFAVAAHLEPEILIVDEVLAVGDIAFQQKCAGKIGEVGKQGRTILVVSHNMATCKSLCSRAILLEHGNVLNAGPVEDVVAQYLGNRPSDSAERAIRREDHAPDSRKVWLRRIKLVNAVDNRFAVHWREPISLLLELEVEERVEQFMLGASVSLPEGPYVFSDLSHDESRAPDGVWTLEPGTYAVPFRLENELRPGTYKLGCGASIRPHLGLSYVFIVAEAAVLEVLDTALEGQKARRILTGIVNGHSHWKPPVRLNEPGDWDKMV